MPQETPRYEVRGRAEKGTEMDVLLPYVAQAIARIMDAALIADIPVIKGKPKRAWMKDWGAIHDEGRTEEEVMKLLEQEDPKEIRRAFDWALSVAANGVIALNQVDFYIAMSNAAINMLAVEGGVDEYLRQK